MWWCGQHPSAKPRGDDILHASGDDLGGRLTGDGAAADAVFSGRRGGFDGMHTCDPSVIKVDDVYYLYYTGADGDHDFGNAIGLATSQDGLSWERANDGDPIIEEAGDQRRDNAYGVGQPAAAHLDGWFYVMFTDTTGEAAGWNGAGQFLLRSPDPAFGEQVEALGPDGFAPVADTARPRTSSLVDAFSVDLMWVDLLDSIAYRSLSFDEDGVAVAEPYVSPAERAPEYTYADDEASIMFTDAVQERDLHAVPNQWVLSVSDADTDPITVTFTNRAAGEMHARLMERAVHFATCSDDELSSGLEAMGMDPGAAMEPARGLLHSAIPAGASVDTANKAMLAETVVPASLVATTRNL
jgi:hypothetical protein